MSQPIPMIDARTCGECTKCCEGWLQTEIYGHPVHRGQPCFYVERRCTIYEQRPSYPCREYNCYWVESDELPLWMKPTLSGVIVSEKVHQTQPQLTYVDVVETNGTISATVLNWLIHWALRKKKNMIYEVNGKKHVLGTSEFSQHLQSLKS